MRASSPYISLVGQFQYNQTTMDQLLQIGETCSSFYDDFIKADI
jgi:hypothetical protein